MIGEVGGSQGGLTHRELGRWLIQHHIPRDMTDGQQMRLLLSLYNQSKEAERSHDNKKKFKGRKSKLLFVSRV